MTDNTVMIDDILNKTYSDGDKTKLSCAAALRIAEKHGVAPLEIGKICNERGIRISCCQLGCFQ